MASNHLALNPYKTQALLISHCKINPKSIHMPINNISINNTLTAKNLGIEIDAILSFAKPIKNRGQKINSIGNSISASTFCR